jgi:hypothetical protein
MTGYELEGTLCMNANRIKSNITIFLYCGKMKKKTCQNTLVWCWYKLAITKIIRLHKIYLQSQKTEIKKPMLFSLWFNVSSFNDHFLFQFYEIHLQGTWVRDGLYMTASCFLFFLLREILFLFVELLYKNLWANLCSMCCGFCFRYKHFSYPDYFVDNPVITFNKF